MTLEGVRAERHGSTARQSRIGQARGSWEDPKEGWRLEQRARCAKQPEHEVLATACRG